MNPTLLKDLQNLDKILSTAKELSINYLQNLDDIPVSKASVAADLPFLPRYGLGAIDTQHLFEEKFYQNIVAASGSRYYGFVQGGATPASIAGDWLTSVFDQNTQSVMGNGDISAVLELHTIKLLLQLFDLPVDAFMGGMVTGATMSNFTGLAVGRQWLGQQLGVDIARTGIPSNLKVFAATPHSSAIKAMSMLGMGSNNITLIPTPEGRECIDTDAFEKILEESGSDPFILISSGGTVNTVDYDDMSFIAALKKKYNFWWHIDAAFGAFAACSTHYNHLLKGWEGADSITVDCHKWLNVPYDSAVIFTRKEHAQLQVQTFQNSNAPYLGDPMQQFNYLNFVPENSRRFRALPAWFSLMAYGKEGYTEIVDRDIALAQELGKRIAETEGFELAAPVRLNTVCFTLTNENRQELIPQLLMFLRKRGKLFITPTVYKSVTCLRAALVNWRTTEKDIDIAVEELKMAYEAISQSKELHYQ